MFFKSNIEGIYDSSNELNDYVLRKELNIFYRAEK